MVSCFTYELAPTMNYTAHAVGLSLQFYMAVSSGL
jgi:hypothetical protein